MTIAFVKTSTVQRTGITALGYDMISRFDQARTRLRASLMRNHECSRAAGASLPVTVQLALLYPWNQEYYSILI